MTSKAVIVGSASTRLLAQKISELETKVQELESGVVVVKPTDQDDEPTVVTDEYKIVVGLNQGETNVLTMTLEECPFENWIISGLWESRSDTKRSATKTGDNTYQVEFNMANDATEEYPLSIKSYQHLSYDEDEDYGFTYGATCVIGGEEYDITRDDNISIKIFSNESGKIPFAAVLGNIFLPKFSSEGDPELAEIYYYIGRNDERFFPNRPWIE